ncbi:hypothetical protein K438DRAFT_2024538 [Mycena galopus ATCC 62051]|nr:hypothetical protein K438DRAFT_2024538 [Mycena galopus ATCC 62051]
MGRHGKEEQKRFGVKEEQGGIERKAERAGEREGKQHGRGGQEKQQMRAASETRDTARCTDSCNPMRPMLTRPSASRECGVLCPLTRHTSFTPIPYLCASFPLLKPYIATACFANDPCAPPAMRVARARNGSATHSCAGASAPRRASPRRAPSPCAHFTSGWGERMNWAAAKPG